MLRIGELSRRVGVSEHLLRAWESRYGLLSPVRSPGGFRLYSAGDEQRVRRMQFHLAQGLRPPKRPVPPSPRARRVARCRSLTAAPTGRTGRGYSRWRPTFELRWTRSTSRRRKPCSTG